MTESEPGSYRVQAEGSPARIAALTAWLAGRDLTVLNLRTGGGGLEDVYMSLVRSTRRCRGMTRRDGESASVESECETCAHRPARSCR